ncbi:non-ribosomal peptide synthetase [Catenulispora sp. NF23]|uniref:Non-ribosomal peptide synthetase n=1 Tax=Catenulispora pinistramenti TaxID=2705254 RepID=A0ABS5KRB3_9ACTN|nr:non-ribosomal peptide synthetase [Catenulispora pinistramenti]MBS2533102.1 non-ribosomal peptide synthetase [Catenulispora pinistramenti]MBS2548571.1 non-ribosomal peptide synthetase [Catenulispora pinistramenti]
MLTPDEISFLDRHSGSVPHYEPTTLHALFRAQAARTPDAEALRADDRSLTYRQLENAANAVARTLAGLGAGPGRPVAVSGERSPQLFTGLLAVLKAGSAILYLDPYYPADYQQAVLKTAEARILVLAPGSTIHAPDRDLAIVPLDDVLDEADRDHEPVADGAGYEDPAYIIFTSGTTGTPKGVVRPHRMHVTRIALEQGMYHLGADDRVLLKSPISFREFLWPLAVGATAVIARDGGERDDRYLLPFLRDQRISVVSFVPSMLRVLVANPDFPALAGSLRHIFAGGERLPADLEEQLRGHGFQVHNTYTLTEADYVVHRKDATQARGRGSVVGTPLDMRVYLVDEAGQRVRPGEVGEILTGGPGLATGYLNRPDLTAERFVANPFDPTVPVVFRTGDLARFLPDGQIDYIGRADLQIKVRGQRVEPTAVESVIREHPAVRDAVAVGFPDADQGARLVAFATPRDAPVPVEEIAAFLRARLPDFMVPASLIWLERLPLLLSGKVDRAALVPEPGVRPDLQTRYIAPRTRHETRLAAVWRQVLGIADIGVDDRFLEIGGDSLRLLILRSIIEQEFGGPVQIADLLDNATIRTQAMLLSAQEPPSAPDPGTAAPSAPDPRAAALAAREAALDQRRQRAASGSVAAVEPS